MKLTTLVYLERDGKYLMLHRTKKENDINFDKWIGVGGKLERGESPEACMRREVLEETGYTVQDFCLRGEVTFLSDISPAEKMFLYTVHGFTGEQRICGEGDLVWVAKTDVHKLTLWEGDHIFLDLLQTQRPFFLLELSYAGERLVRAVLDGETIKGENP